MKPISFKSSENIIEKEDQSTIIILTIKASLGQPIKSGLILWIYKSNWSTDPKTGISRNCAKIFKICLEKIKVRVCNWFLISQNSLQLYLQWCQRTKKHYDWCTLRLFTATEHRTTVAAVVANKFNLSAHSTE